MQAALIGAPLAIALKSRGEFMDRRKFICRITAGTAGRLNVVESAAAKENRTVVYNVEGFTCITCAVGLEVMLRTQKGVTRASASYPDKKVAIGLDADLTSEKTLKDFIASCGFTVSRK
jgi:copper chaperone CopZ